MTYALLVRSRVPYKGIVLSQSVCALIGVSSNFVSANDQSLRDIPVFDAENASSQLAIAGNIIKSPNNLSFAWHTWIRPLICDRKRLGLLTFSACAEYSLATQYVDTVSHPLSLPVCLTVGTYSNMDYRAVLDRSLPPDSV